MKTLLVLTLALCSSAAFARPNTTNLTCRDASGLVANSGAIVLSTGKSYLYDRFVAHAGFCGAGEAAVVAYVKTKDNAACNIGYACANASEGGNSVSKVYPSEIIKCKDGKIGSVPGLDHRGEQVDFPAVCKNGKYYRLDGYVAPTPVYRGCKEGQKGWLTVPAQWGPEPETTVPAVCKNGKYVRLY